MAVISMDAGTVGHKARQAVLESFDYLATRLVLPETMHCPLGTAEFQGQTYKFELVVTETTPGDENG